MSEMLLRRRCASERKEYVYQLYNVQLNGTTTSIDTGVKLMALPFNWKLRMKVTNHAPSSNLTILDCNNESNTLAYGSSGMGIICRSQQKGTMTIKVGDKNSFTLIDSYAGEYGQISTAGDDIKYGIPMFSTKPAVQYVIVEIIKIGTVVTCKIDDCYMVINWTGQTNKNLYVGCNVVESSGVKRRFYDGHIEYLTIEKL